MSVTVIDTETTGLFLEGEEPPGVVEVAAVRVERRREGWAVSSSFSTLVNPGLPIPPTARAVHHISDADVKRAPTLQDVREMKSLFRERGDSRAAHNAAYDQKFFEEEDWICTWRCAKHIYPDAPGHGNQVLRYWLGLDAEMRRNRGTAKALSFPPHRALPDAWVTAHLLVRLLEGREPADLLALTREPILLRRVHFGKHAGQDWSTVPADYLQWLLRNNETKPGSWDPDVLHTAEHYYRRAR